MAPADVRQKKTGSDKRVREFVSSMGSDAHPHVWLREEGVLQPWALTSKACHFNNVGNRDLY